MTTNRKITLSVIGLGLLSLFWFNRPTPGFVRTDTTLNAPAAYDEVMAGNLTPGKRFGLVGKVLRIDNDCVIVSTNSNTIRLYLSGPEDLAAIKPAEFLVVRVTFQGVNDGHPVFGEGVILTAGHAGYAEAWDAFRAMGKEYGDDPFNSGQP